VACKSRNDDHRSCPPSRGDVGAAPFQSKEIGESAISQVAPAIANAVYDAVGVRIKDLPITAEKVYFGLQALRSEGKAG